MSMLEVVQFENGRYGLRNLWTGIVIDREFWTVRGAVRARRKRVKKLNQAIGSINKRGAA